MLVIPDHVDDIGTALSQAARLLAAARSVGEIVSILRKHSRAIVGSDGIAVILRDGASCHYVAEDAIEPLWLNQRFPMTSCVSGWAMLNDATVVIPDIEADPRVPLPDYCRTSIRSLAMVPIGSPDSVAALGAYWCAFIEPDEATVRKLEILAQVASVAFARGSASSPMDAAAGCG